MIYELDPRYLSLRYWDTGPPPPTHFNCRCLPIELVDDYTLAADSVAHLVAQVGPRWRRWLGAVDKSIRRWS